MKNYFAFIDESGNSSQERFFGLGLLLVGNEIGDLYDGMKPFYDKAYDIARVNKINRVSELQKQNELEQLSQIAKSSKKFELKFKYVNFTNNNTYAGLVEKYFTFKNARFCTLVIDRKEISKNKAKWQLAINPWDTYIHQAAMLLANNIKNILPCSVCILADDLTKPRNVQKSFENSLKDAINYRLGKRGIGDAVFGITRLESHSSLLLQVVDVLLGCVMYDFKIKAGLISEMLAKRQGVVVEKVREILEVSDLAVNKTSHQPSYFSVWKFKK